MEGPVTLDEADCLGLDERRQLDELLRAAREVPENYEDLTSQPGPPHQWRVPTDPPREPEEPSRDDLHIDMEAVEPMTPLEEARETESSTEIGEQSISWRRHEENLGQQNWTEIPHEENVGNPQFKRARLEASLEDEQEKTGKDETEPISPENILMTKSQGRPNSSTASSILDKRQYDREISFHQLPEADVPLYQEAERVQWDESVMPTDPSKFIHRLRPPRFVSKFPGKDVCTQDLHIEIKTRVCWIWPVITALPGQRPKFNKNRRSNSALDSRKRLPSTGLINGMLSESQSGAWMFLVPSCEENLEK